MVLDSPSDMNGRAPIQYLELSDVRRGDHVRVHLATDSIFLYRFQFGMRSCQSEHDNATLSKDWEWDAHLYRVARKAKRYFAFLLAETESLEGWKLRFMEQFLILFWGCYPDFLLVAPKASNDEEVADWTKNNWHAYVLNDIAVRAFRDAQWATETRATHSGGCNVQSPSAIDNDIDRVIWTRMTNRAGTLMTVRRRSSNITVAAHKGGTNGVVHLFGTTVISVPEHVFKSMNTSLPVNLVFEVRLDRRPHDAPPTVDYHWLGGIQTGSRRLLWVSGWNIKPQQAGEPCTCNARTCGGIRT